MLIARNNEIKILEDAYSADESKFIAIYGRRRIGKTYLIRKTFTDRITFAHTGYSGGNMKEQLFAFSASLREFGYEDFGRPSSWLEAFELLKDLIRASNDVKKVIFLDELSWMDTAKSDFLMALEGFWNGWASARNDILLIVCGSATSWIMDNIIHNKGGLYNRLSYQIELLPFTLGECETYAKANHIVMNRHQLLNCYMILGGVPFYWSLLKKGLSLPQNIDNLFFARNAALKDEFQYLYSSLFKKPDRYIDIVNALGKNKAGMTREELLAATKESNSGAFTKRLLNLINCGFIRKYNEFGKKTRNCRYRLVDNFTLFYYKFMADRPNDAHFWENHSESAEVNAWCGLAFERVCFEHIDQIKKALGISGVSTEVYSWSCKRDIENGINGSQIDMLIVRKDQIINVCEMKFARGKYTVTSKTDTDIRKKINDFFAVTETRYAIHPIIVTTYGLTENAYAGNIQAVITAEDLFN